MNYIIIWEYCQLFTIYFVILNKLQNNDSDKNIFYQDQGLFLLHKDTFYAREIKRGFYFLSLSFKTGQHNSHYAAFG